MNVWILAAAAAVVLLLLVFGLRRAAVHRRQRQAGKAGEERVEAILREWVRKRRGWQLVARDCRGPYSARCILLLPPGSPAPQEVDHLLVGPAGVVAVETKNYGGTIQVLSDAVWRRSRGGGRARRTESPTAQVRRHASVLRALLPGVPVHSLICIANDGAVLRGRRRSDVPIVTAAELPAYLDRLARQKALAPRAVDAALQAIEAAKKRR